MEEQNNDDEISIDFSKIKNFFKKKTEKSKVEKIEKEAEEVNKEIVDKINKDKEELEILQKDEKKVEEIEKELEKEENEAMVVDAEKKLIDNKIQKEKEQLRKIEEDVKDEDEISFDFSKIKNFFKGIKTEKSKEKNEEELSIDFKKAGHFLKKYHLLLIILIPFILSIYLRAMPGYLPITDEWAKSTAYNNIKQQISTEIRAQYPNLPQANINNLMEGQFQQVIKANKADISAQIKQLSDYFKSRLQKDGQTYLIAIDPYFWLRHTKNILENGHPGDELRDLDTGEKCDKQSEKCVPWDTHMYAPLGRQAPGDMFHSYFEAYLHKFLSIFNPKQDLMGTAFIVPIILSALCIIPAFFIAKRAAGNFGGFIAGMFVALHPAFLTRTVGGFSDTDAYNVLFPLFITWIFLEAFEARKNWKKSIILTSVAGLLVGMYALSWSGWWYIFDFIIISLLAFIGIHLIMHRDNLKKVLKEDTMKHAIITLLIFFISSLLVTTIIVGFETFKGGVFDGPMGFAKLKEVGITSVWPNVYTTVAEQNTASLNSVIDQIGMNSLILFIMAILGIILTITNRKREDKKDFYYFIASVIWLILIMVIKPEKLIVFLVLISLPVLIRIIIAIYNKNFEIDFKLALILIIWFTSTLYASTKGIRYMLLVVPAFSVGLGVSFGFAYNYLSRFIKKGLYLNEVLAKIIVMMLLLLLLINPIKVSTAIAKQEIPSMNDAWYNSLDKIRLESEPNAIINSWWDFGHWFKSIGDRAVTFDGTSQNTPMAHWIGHSLLTNNEDDAIGILRMLDCGSNTAFNKLNEEINDTTKSVYIIHDIVKLDKEDARKYLLNYVDGYTADEVLKYTHCEPPEDYYITSDDMVGKSGVWGHFGIWDFNRSLIYNTLKKKEYVNNKEISIEFIKSRFNYPDDKAESIYYEVNAIKNSEEANSWIAPWPSYASGIGSCRTDKETLLCPISAQQTSGTINIKIDLKNKTAEINAPQGKKYPNAVVYPTKGGIEKISYSNDTIGYSIALIPNNGGWDYVMMLPPLEDSMFTRLFFLDGHGMTKFKKFSDEKSVVGNRIIVWKVDWEGTEKNLVYFSENQITEEKIEEPPEEIIAEPDNQINSSE